jgi:acetyltransferase-like isoleucine patch superfamily enzyme
MSKILLDDEPVAAQRSLPRFKKAKDYLMVQFGAIHLRLFLVQLLIRCLPDSAFGNVRAALYRAAGFVDIGANVYFGGMLQLRGYGDIYSRLHIGDGTIINAPCYIELNAPVVIGRDVAIGHHTTIITSTHDLGPAARRCGPRREAPVAIGDGSWVGAQSTILGGVTIGPGAFVSVGSVVTKDVPANAQVGGNPSRVVRLLED